MVVGSGREANGNGNGKASMALAQQPNSFSRSHPQLARALLTQTTLAVKTDH